MMKSTHRPQRILAWLALCFALATSVHAEVQSRISSRFLARGEQALLEIAVVGQKPTRYPEIAEVKGVTMQPTGTGPQNQMLPGRQIEHVFSYIVSSYDVGKHTIPPVTVTVGTETFTTQAIDFMVFNPDELKWSETTVGNTKFRYASTFKAMDPDPYVGESIPVEIKVFVPRDIFVVDWGIPDFERDGLTAWRFQPSLMRSQINLLGTPYISVAYPSSLTPTRTGTVAIGPASIRLITTQVVMDGILRRVHVQTSLDVPKLELECQALPSNPPTGFENAVGKFSIKVTTPTTDVQEGDPIPLEITVTGTGNLDTLQPPKPDNSLGWKLYDASREQRNDERRMASGNTVFRQFMRPLELKGSIPAFKLIYFNPATKRYESTETEPIPLQMTPAAATAVAPPVGPPPAATTPVEQMTDILGLIPQAPILQTDSRIHSSSKIHLTAGILALLLIAKAYWMRNKHRFHKDPDQSARKAELGQIEQLQKNDHEFLMAAGRFIERWLGGNHSEELQRILAERDALCFRKEKDSTGLDGPSKQRIVNTLRKAVNLWAIFVVLCLSLQNSSFANSPGEAAEENYHAARYDKAIEAWLKSGPYEDLSANTLYHIGNACYRAGSPGNAALYYRRALARNLNHHESRQNLRFIERKYGALTVHRPDYEYKLAMLPLSTWQNIVWAGLWLCALGILVFPATRYGSRLRVVAILAVVVGPMLATFGALGWNYFPNDATFAPISRQAVIIDEKAGLHTEAARTSPEILQAPAGSLCEVIHENGKWTYVAFASQTRGWIPSAAIQKVIPKQTPRAPNIQKPVPSDDNA